MAYFCKHAASKTLPLTAGTFSQVVKWLLKAQKQGALNHEHYQIWGADLKKDPAELICDFFADDVAESLV